MRNAVTEKVFDAPEPVHISRRKKFVGKPAVKIAVIDVLFVFGYFNRRAVDADERRGIAGDFYQCQIGAVGQHKASRRAFARPNIHNTRTAQIGNAGKIFVKFERLYRSASGQIDMPRSIAPYFNAFNGFRIADIQFAAKIVGQIDAVNALFAALAALDKYFAAAVAADRNISDVNGIKYHVAAERIADDYILLSPVFAQFDIGIAIITDFEVMKAGIPNVQHTAVNIADFQIKAFSAVVHGNIAAAVVSDPNLRYGRTRQVERTDKTFLYRYRFNMRIVAQINGNV